MKKRIVFVGIFLILFTTYDLALSDGIVKYDINDGIVAYYPFSSNAIDESSNSHDGTVVNATLSYDRFGSNNSSYSFDGDDYINTNIKLLNGDKSISIWFKPNESMKNVEFNVIAGFHAVTDNRFYIGVSEGKFVIGLGDDAYEFDLLDTTMKWHHFVLVSDENKGLVYQNGTYAGTVSWNGKNDGNGNDLNIGRGGGTDNRYFNGIIDDVSIYNRVLSELEIKVLYDYRNYECIYSDSDFDGVVDKWDTCPQTATNTAVYSNGCKSQDLYLKLNTFKNQIELKDQEINDKDQLITTLNLTISSQDQEIIDLNSKINSMYTIEQMEKMIENILNWGDTDGDGKIGIKEAIQALIITSGINSESKNE